MTLRFADSFDHYTDPIQKGWVLLGAGLPTIIGAAARTGIAGMRLDNDNERVALTLDAQGTWVVGFGFRPAGIRADDIVRTLDAAAEQGVLGVNGDGTLRLDRAGTTVATSVNALIAGVYYYIEFKHIINNAGGTLEVRVDGAVWATFAGDTQATANATANRIALGVTAGLGAVVSYDHDDLYILDGTGGAPFNDYLGDTQIECILPDGAGNYAEFANLFGAPTHWQACDEVPPDEDASYIDTAVLNDRDTFTFGNLSVASATLRGLQVCMRARKTGAGAANIARMYRRAGADHQGANVPLQTSYAYHLEILEQDPQAGPGPWTVANVNAAEFGARAT